MNSRPSHAKTPWRTTGLVLLVEDEELVREVFQMMLEECGFTVIAAADGASGVEAFRRHATELRAVVCDEALGDTTGWDALREMRDIRSDVPALLCSGYPYADETQALRSNGWAGFLQKPFTPEMLRAKMRSILDSQDAPTRS